MASVARAVRVSGSEKNCPFCKVALSNEVLYGELFQYKNYRIHHYCVLLSHGLYQSGEDEDGVYGFLYADIQSTLERVQHVMCSFCKKEGASIKCFDKNCNVTYHLPCGLENGCMSQFDDKYPSFCQNHRPKQYITARIMREALGNPPICPICINPVDPIDRVKSLWAPCCAKTWYHRVCVAGFALSSGRLFKCSACSNGEEFRTAMIKYGICVPKREASWETVPNAYAELRYRHEQCDVKVCKYPRGRNKKDHFLWDIILCESCGSQGTHIRCSNLNYRNCTWECPTCKSASSRLNTDKD